MVVVESRRACPVLSWSASSWSSTVYILPKLGELVHHFWRRVSRETHEESLRGQHHATGDGEVEQADGIDGMRQDAVDLAHDERAQAA